MTAKGRAWKSERSRMRIRGESKLRSKKYSQSDSKSKPEPGSRQRVWVSGYTRSDGAKVRGHYRTLAQS
jgi:hypothetical protein